MPKKSINMLIFNEWIPIYGVELILKGGVQLKRFSVYIMFKNGSNIHFETDTNLNLAEPQSINGGQFIVTENDHVINLLQVEEMKVVQKK